MKIILSVLVPTLVVALFVTAQGEDQNKSKLVVKWGEEVAQATPSKGTPKEAAPLPVVSRDEDANRPAIGRELSLRERNELGLTLKNLREAVRELKTEGLLTASTPRGEMSALVFERLQSKSPQAFAAEALDLDAVLEWIERWLPLILKLLALL